MKNEEYLATLGIKVTGTIEEKNQQLNNYFNVNSASPFSLIFDNGEKLKIDGKNFKLCFSDVIWKFLPLKEKIILLRWAQIDHLQDNLKLVIKPFVFIDEHEDKFSYAPAYASNDYIYLNLKSVNDYFGYAMYYIIVHETQHTIDYMDFYEDIKQILPYINKSYWMTSSLSKLIMNLDLNGKHYNYLTNKDEYFTDEIKRTLLKVKNNYVTINSTSAPPNSKKKVMDEDGFYKFINHFIYFKTPLEDKAYTVCYEKTLELIRENNSKYNYESKNLDNKLYSATQKLLLRQMSYTRQLQKYFNMNIYDIIDMELVHQYNLVYKANIRPDLMKKREEKLKKLYNWKFNKKHESHLKEFLKIQDEIEKNCQEENNLSF